MALPRLQSELHELDKAMATNEGVLPPPKEVGVRLQSAMSAYMSAVGNCRQGSIDHLHAAILKHLDAYRHALVSVFKDNDVSVMEELAPDVSAVLAEASLVLPHEAWVSDMRMQFGRVLQNQGSEARMTALMSACGEVAKTVSATNMSSLKCALSQAKGMKVAKGDMSRLEALGAAANKLLPVCAGMQEELGDASVGTLEELLELYEERPAPIAEFAMVAACLRKATQISEQLTTQAASTSEAEVVRQESDIGYKNIHALHQQTSQAKSRMGALNEDMTKLLDAPRKVALGLVDKWLQARKQFERDTLESAIGDFKPISGGAPEGATWSDGLADDATMDAIYARAAETLGKTQPKFFVAHLDTLQQAALPQSSMQYDWLSVCANNRACSMTGFPCVARCMPAPQHCMVSRVFDSFFHMLSKRQWIATRRH